MDQLADDVKQAIEDASNIDLSGYQTDQLLTDNKSVIGAINELYGKLNNEIVSLTDIYNNIVDDMGGE
jgi:hypothetical protein